MASLLRLKRMKIMFLQGTAHIFDRTQSQTCRGVRGNPIFAFFMQYCTVVRIYLEHSGKYQHFENPRVFKHTFPLKLCVGSDGRVSIMSRSPRNVSTQMFGKCSEKKQ